MELSREDLMSIKVLIKERNHGETSGFNLEKSSIDSLGSSEQKNYDLLLRKIEDEIKNMDM